MDYLDLQTDAPVISRLCSAYIARLLSLLSCHVIEKHVAAETEEVDDSDQPMDAISGIDKAMREAEMGE